MHFLTFVGYYSLGARVLATVKRNRSFLNYTCFFACDLLGGVAEKGGVVYGNSRNYFTTFASSDEISHAFDAGAKGAILKSADLDGLLAAIRAVAKGNRHCSAEIEQIMADDPPVPKLSARQQEILESIVHGLSNPDIARQLGISLPMVKEHLTTLFAKLGVANRTEAVAVALRKQLLKI